jgi:hypothetical protein
MSLIDKLLNWETVAMPFSFGEQMLHCHEYKTYDKMLDDQMEDVANLCRPPELEIEHKATNESQTMGQRSIQTESRKTQIQWFDRLLKSFATFALRILDHMSGTFHLEAQI